MNFWHFNGIFCKFVEYYSTHNDMKKVLTVIALIMITMHLGAQNPKFTYTD